jgi:hypothetical protein
MQRKEITAFKTSFWGDVKPVYGQDMVKSLLTIRHVVDVNIHVDDRLIADCNSSFTVLFGLKVDQNRLYLGSVEEVQGKILCQIIIKVKEISIEYSDEVVKPVYYP